MKSRLSVLIFGASYGSLLATKVALAGHGATMVCTPAEAELFNREGAILRLPVKGRQGLVEVRSLALPGKLSASTPAEASPAGHDLVVLGMQEPQYRSAGVRELLAAVAQARLPCMSIMNMPPLPYLARIPGVQTGSLRDCFAEAAVWDGFDPKLMTLCSPDPQAFRPPEEKANVLQVRLPTNFKSARFEADAHTALLRQLEADIDAARFEGMELPVKLRVHDSVFVPLAKWAMLLAGNYRCIRPEGIRSIQETVHSDLEASRSIYDWVVQLCVALGADAKDMVPFEKYAAAAQLLLTPSSAARAVQAGAPNIERTDRLVKAIGAQKGMRSAAVDEIVAVVDARLEANRGAAGR
jgi:hypothetical protein